MDSNPQDPWKDEWQKSSHRKEENTADPAFDQMDLSHWDRWPQYPKEKTLGKIVYAKKSNKHTVKL